MPVATVARRVYFVRFNDQKLEALDTEVAVPGGAHPSYAHGYYKRDNAYYKAWDPIARDRDTFLAWMKENVLDKGPEAYDANRIRKWIEQGTRG